ncbi:CBS domain-containing protein [Streptomyces sp. NPDC059631]
MTSSVVALAGGAAEPPGRATAPAVTVRAGATVAGAARLMARRGVEHLPVVDDAGRLIGIGAPAGAWRRLASARRETAENRRRPDEARRRPGTVRPGSGARPHRTDGPLGARPARLSARLTLPPENTPRATPRHRRGRTFSAEYAPRALRPGGRRPTPGGPPRATAPRRAEPRPPRPEKRRSAAPPAECPPSLPPRGRPVPAPLLTPPRRTDPASPAAPLSRSSGPD